MLTVSHILQVYIGQIPKDVYEDALIPLFEALGTIYDLSKEANLILNI